MTKYVPAVVTGLVVSVALSFVLGFAASASGQPPSSPIWLPGLIFGAITTFAMANLVGTKGSKAATPAQKEAALAFRAEPGQALLIVFREGFVGKAVGLNLVLDGVAAAQLKSPRFTALSIAPGAHVLAAGFGGLAASQNRPVEERFTAAPGDLMAFRAVMSMGMAKNTIRLERVDDRATLAAKLKAMTMIAPHAQAEPSAATSLTA
ncbi:hypothetical protein [Caulobacter rhizosphaerae]|jgi:hypothetical protein|uniref:hypothetical protein n=1 Tax=Caulobacter rhizosphaerae TaxID=2010972 RepID=UPI0013CF9AC7|nr:hypothetical protein [Caulobacter rhizosphaerae]GGL31871.1 hypothetical protein GCM10010983_31330 [Caulobacter rhizosphaerae]